MFSVESVLDADASGHTLRSLGLCDWRWLCRRSLELHAVRSSEITSAAKARLAADRRCLGVVGRHVRLGKDRQELRTGIEEVSAFTAVTGCCMAMNLWSVSKLQQAKRSMGHSGLPQQGDPVGRGHAGSACSVRRMSAFVQRSFSLLARQCLK